MSETTSIQFDLSPSERQLWSGVPRQGLVFHAGDLLVVPFSLLWTGGVVSIGAKLWTQDGTPTMTKAVGFAFLCVGLYITVGRFAYDAWLRSRTTYGLTTERVLIASAGLMPSIKSLDLGTLPSVILNERPDGRGTITFGQPTMQWTSRMPQAPAFEGITDAKAVYEQIRAAQREARTVAG
jgi:hypothetical protein